MVPIGRLIHAAIDSKAGAASDFIFLRDLLLYRVISKSIQAEDGRETLQKKEAHEMGEASRPQQCRTGLYCFAIA
jgi:hypothetical protein